MPGNGVRGYLYGTNSYWFASPLIGYGSDYTEEGTWYPGASISTFYVIANKILCVTGASILQMNQSYKFVNCEVPSLYWLSANSAINGQPSIYMMENVLMKTIPSYNWNIRFYAYAPAQPYQHIYKFLNIDSEYTDNVKRCIHNSVINCKALFYRRVEIYVKDIDEVNIEDVNITITDSLSNVYSGSTDIDGYVYVDCVEQKTEYVLSDADITSWTDSWDIYYSDFTINISKEGYEDSNIIQVNKISEIPVIQMTLKPVVKTRVTIDGNVVAALQPELGSSSQLVEL